MSVGSQSAKGTQDREAKKGVFVFVFLHCRAEKSDRFYLNFYFATCCQEAAVFDVSLPAQHVG